MTMDFDIINISLPNIEHDPMSVDASSSHIFSCPVTESDMLVQENGRRMMVSCPPFSYCQQQSSNPHTVIHDNMISREMPLSSYTTFVGSSYDNHDTMPEHLGGTVSATSLVNCLSASAGPQENLFGASVSSALPMTAEDLRKFSSIGRCDAFSFPITTTPHFGYGAQDDTEFSVPHRDANLDEDGHRNVRLAYDQIVGHGTRSGRKMNTVPPSYHVVGNSEADWFLDKSNCDSNNLFAYSHVLSNDLSLGLGSCHSPILNTLEAPDQFSEISCSAITQVASSENRVPDIGGLQVPSRVQQSLHEMGLETQTFSDKEDFSANYSSSSRPVHFSRVLLGSRYLHVAQQILAEVASYAFGESNESGTRTPDQFGKGRASFSHDTSGMRHVSFIESHHCSHPPNDTQQIRDTKTKKVQLLAILQMIDQSYYQCADKMKSVMSSFYIATESSAPEVHVRFAFHTVSSLYKNLRERITSQILLANQHLSSETFGEKAKHFESSFIHRQWTLQQMKSDHQSWRPQRGLPERSVSVLRAWMFQNFLHPYPKDHEKQLLAIKSGLTRSQVSNWFINARVRLWKPMIEEMYSEISKKHQTEDSIRGCRSHASIDRQRFPMN